MTGGEWASDRQSTNPDRQAPGDTSAREEVLPGIVSTEVDRTKI